MCAILVSKMLWSVRVRDHTALPATHTYEMNHSAFTPKPQSITALRPYISNPTKSRRLSWPGWLGEILRWFVCLKTVAYPALSRGSMLK